MRTLIKLSFLIMLLVVSALAAISWFALSDAALVNGHISLSHADIARAKSIIKRNDPRRLPNGAVHSVAIEQQDLDLAAAYLLQQIFDGRAQLSLGNDWMDARFTFHLPILPARPYANLRARLLSEQGQPRITGLKVGDMPIPDAVSNLLFTRALAYVLDADDSADVIRHLQLRPQHARLTYRWNSALIDSARDTLLSRPDRDALRYYHDELVALQAKGTGRRGKLVDLLQPLFAAAQARSRQRDPIVENTALLTVLGTWASRHNLARLVPGDLARPDRFRLRLQGRIDFAQHFLASAALAARGDSALSDAVGLFKEIDDTERGSGFSFTDIAADRAGSRFGELATATSHGAGGIQGELANGIVDGDILPPVDDLPEHMRGPAFKARFGHVGSPAYLAVMSDIEQRIDATRLYRN